MYILYDDKGMIIGCHDELIVVEEYADNLKFYHDTHSRIRYMKDKKAVKVFGDKLEEFELTAFKGTYVPYKYIDCVEYASHDMRDIQYCKDVLMSLYKDESLSKRESKNIKKVIFLLDDIIQDANNYTSSPDELKRLKSSFDEMVERYTYNMYY